MYQTRIQRFWFQKNFLSRNGDLVQEIYLHTDGTGAITAPDTVEVEIGGQRIDKHYKVWLDIYDDLFETNNTLKGAYQDSYMPLRFWFNRNPGLALPLIALQYHEVKVIVEGGANIGDLLVNYVYLDTDERRRFAQVSHEYLIEQVQHTGTESVGTPTAGGISKSITLTYNHPVKGFILELGWC